MPPDSEHPPEDPVYRNSLKDARFGMTFWAIATVVVCILAYVLGYQQTDRKLTSADIQPILGMPRWFFISVLIPWLICSVVCVVYAGFIMTDDDLGKDHTDELEQEIREGTDIHELV
ncbi:MAG: hypothetical protein RJA81_2054 [Planctomycetota bacterium]|jgi:uncharacterized membrane protein YhdT